MGKSERGLSLPSLLSWLIRHPERWAAKPGAGNRALLQRGDPEVVECALKALRSSAKHRDGFSFEGRTCPAALIETPDALVVIDS